MNDSTPDPKNESAPSFPRSASHDGTVECTCGYAEGMQSDPFGGAYLHRVRIRTDADCPVHNVFDPLDVSDAYITRRVRQPSLEAPPYAGSIESAEHHLQRAKDALAAMARDARREIAHLRAENVTLRTALTMAIDRLDDPNSERRDRIAAAEQLRGILSNS